VRRDSVRIAVVWLAWLGALLATVWGNRRGVEENTLDAFVRLLRKKVDQESDVKLIHTHRGVGYSMRAPAEP